MENIVRIGKKYYLMLGVNLESNKYPSWTLINLSTNKVTEYPSKDSLLRDVHNSKGKLINLEKEDKRISKVLNTIRNNVDSLILSEDKNEEVHDIKKALKKLEEYK